MGGSFDPFHPAVGSPFSFQRFLGTPLASHRIKISDVDVGAYTVSISEKKNNLVIVFTISYVKDGPKQHFSCNRFYVNEMKRFLLIRESDQTVQ